MSEEEWDTHELAWAAGLFDGEGYTGLVTDSKGKARLHMDVGQNNPIVLHRFGDAVGIGPVNGPYIYKGRSAWHWQMQNFEGVQYVCALLWKYLSPVKKAQISLALKTLKSLPDRRPKRKGRKLSYRGWRV